MRDQRQIVERWQQGSAALLVTLVRVQGSSYRQQGARLLLCNDGTYAGSISAGCLEADLLRKAAWLARDGSVVTRYSTVFDEAAEMPFGLGCGGVLDLLLEPAGTAEFEALMQAMESALLGHERLVATWLPEDQRTMMRAVFHPDGALIFASDGLSSEALLRARMQAMHNTEPAFPELCVERLMPPQRLFVFGAGDDAKPLVAMASLLGWSVTVIDGRTHLARKSRFAESNTDVVAAVQSAIPEIASRDAVVIMSHSYEQDSSYLTSILPLRPVYLGLLGSRQRSSLLISEAAAELDLSVSECCERTCAPAGLDIGGEGPEAIALAILAEVQAYCAGRGSRSGKLSAERVERYLAGMDARPNRQIQCALDTV